MKQSLLVAALLALAVSACSKKEEAPAEQPMAAPVEQSAPAMAPAADASAPAADASAPAAADASAPAAK